MKLRRIRRATRLLAIAGLRALPGTLRDLVGLAGAVGVTFGAWEIFAPLGPIVAGGFAIFIAWRLASPIETTPPQH
jgi:hypothetical protein